MGERDLKRDGSTGRYRNWGRWLMPVALLAFLTIVEVARPATHPASARGVAHYLQAASVAHDRDSTFAVEDLDRLRKLPQTEALSILLARRPDGTVTFPGAGPEALWLAPFVAVGGLGGAVFGTALAVALAMGLAATTMKQRLHAPWGILLLALFASCGIRFLLEPRSEMLVLAAVLAAFALAYRGESAHFAEMPEIYDDALRLGSWRFGLRWLIVGGLLAVAMLAHPIYLVLFVPAGLAVPTLARRAGIAWLVAGALALTAVTLVATGAVSSIPWLRETAVFGPASGFPTSSADWTAGEGVPSLFEAARPQAHLGLLAWNGLFLTLGRTVGAVPYFLPLLLLLALWEPRRGRSPLVVAGAVVAILALVVWPFDWAGDSGGLGNALLLPAFGALWLLPTRPTKGRWIVMTTLAAGALLWPMWLDLVGLRPSRGTTAASVPSLAARWLPAESTLRAGADELIRQGSLSLRVAGGAVAERGGSLVIDGGRWGNLLVIAERPLESVLLEFDGQAGSEIDISGGELGNTVFRGDGGVAFEVSLGDSDRKHPLWWSRQEHSLYDLRLRLPKAPPFPVAFRVEALDTPGL